MVCRRFDSFFSTASSTSQCAIFLNLLIVLSALIITVSSSLPDELDPFLEKLFEFEECEDFLGSTEYNNIGTSKCSPLTCDFPRQLCARPAAKFQDASANTCRTVPTECLTAANGGVPVASSGRPNPPTPTVRPSVISPMIGQVGGHKNVGAVVTPSPEPMSICNMGVPNGRFCGFRPMFTYNKETLQCDEFWFPGCRTAETNANLFENYQQCQQVAEMCRPTPAPPTFPPFRPPPPPPTTRRPVSTPPPPPPPMPSSQFVDAFKSFGGAGNSQVGQGALGAIGMFTGSGLDPTGQGPLGNFAPNPNGGGGAGAATGAGGGDGQDLGLFGLIQQGIMGAQAAGQGKGGKEAASKAAGKILEQFTGFDLGGLGNNFGGLFGR